MLFNGRGLLLAVTQASQRASCQLRYLLLWLENLFASTFAKEDAGLVLTVDSTILLAMMTQMIEDGDGQETADQVHNIIV